MNYEKTAEQVQQDHLAALKNAVVIGRRSYEKGLSFDQWAERMMLAHGRCFDAFLPDAWKYVVKGTMPTIEDITKPRFAFLRQVKTQSFLAGLMCGFIVAAVLLLVPGHHRQGPFELRNLGSGVVKMDTQSGEVWLLTRDGVEVPFKRTEKR